MGYNGDGLRRRGGSPRTDASGEKDRCTDARVSRLDEGGSLRPKGQEETMETKKLNRGAIVVCDCKNEYQDSVCGKQHRVANPVNRLQKEGIYAVRCTVCGKVHNLGSMSNARYF